MKAIFPPIISNTRTCMYSNYYCCAKYASVCHLYTRTLITRYTQFFIVRNLNCKNALNFHVVNHSRSSSSVTANSYIHVTGWRQCPLPPLNLQLVEASAPTATPASCFLHICKVTNHILYIPAVCIPHLHPYFPKNHCIPYPMCHLHKLQLFHNT